MIKNANSAKQSLTLGIVALVFEFISFFILGFLAPLGCILSIVGLVESMKAKKVQEQTQSNYLPGFILCIIGIILGVIFTILWIMAVITINS